VVKRAVARTLQEAGAAVVVEAGSAMSGVTGETSLRLAGHVDFAADRCRLDGPTGAVVCDGSTQFSQLTDGRWVRQREAGRWSNLHPHWALELLTRAAHDPQQTAPGRVAVTLDVGRASAITYGGIPGQWAASGEVELDEVGRIGRLDVRLRADDAALTWTITFEHFGPITAIDLPPPNQVVELDAHVEMLHRHPPGPSGS
jgi:hypothetical protein